MPKIKEHFKNNLQAVFFSTLAVAALFAFCYVMNYPLIIPILLIYIAIHLSLFKKARLRLYLNLSLLLALIVFIAHMTTQYATFSHNYVPVAVIAMLTILLFNDLHITFIMAFISSVLVSTVLGGDFEMMFIFLIGSLTGAYLVRDARNRGQLLSAGIAIGLIHTLCLVLLNPQPDLLLSKIFLMEELKPLAFNGIISVGAVLVTLKIFESLFGALTNFSLLELSDFNHPLLKRMILEAPGTYHHSLVVSNLAEAAADAIGANALLARVGSYYHDIGKLSKAEYFTENQLMGGNKHDLIEPSMSRLVILNHVKEGMEIAKQYKLNQAIIDFIPQHHGTGLMYYFYQRALSEAKDGQVVDETEYRYPGPKPQTRETAVTLLADSVEGATRSLDDHNHSSIEDTVKKIINNKFIDGQLDESNLSLRDIHKISQTFTRILTAMYHNRVKYPEKKNGHHLRQPAKENNPPTANPARHRAQDFEA